MHSIPALNNVSMATGTFLQHRGGRPRAGVTSTSAALRGQRRFSALGTYNRRDEATGRQHAPLASLGSTSYGGATLQRITSGRSSFAGSPTLQRLASHIGKPRFNALARLASTALSSRRSHERPTVASAAVAAVAAPPAPAPAQQVSKPAFKLDPHQM